MAKKTHGLSGTPEYTSWRAMLARCYKPQANGYEHYGGRGISVCKRWVKSFENFLSDMGSRPSVSHTLDRYPNKDGNYKKSNCRWATKSEQRRNQKDSIYLTIGGVRQPLIVWCSRYVINYQIVIKRYRELGWPLDENIFRTDGYRNKQPVLSKAAIDSSAAKNRKAVLMVSENGAIIKEWRSVTEAASELGILRTHIAQACRGVCGSAKGKYFKYKSIAQ